MDRTTQPRRAVVVLPWVLVGIATLVVLAAEAFLALFSIAPLFGEYPTRTESRSVALVMISMVLLEAALAGLAWVWGRRWLIAVFVVPAVAAAVQAVALLLNTAPDDERTNPPWDTVTVLVGLNLALIVVVIVVGVLRLRRRARRDHADPTP